MSSQTDPQIQEHWQNLPQPALVLLKAIAAAFFNNDIDAAWAADQEIQRTHPAIINVVNPQKARMHLKARKSKS